VRLVPLAGRTESAVRIALLSLGWEGDLASTTSAGQETLAYHLSEAPVPCLEALVRAAGRLGLEVVTGPDWAILAGPRARLAALARPWTSPEPLVELATLLGHALPADPPRQWDTASGPIRLDQPVIVGIINVTPDSFSDGGRHLGASDALRHAERLIQDGAGVLDVGGESTRPGAEPVPEPVERDRVVPVIEALRREHPQVPLSIDTVKAGVARAALEAGAAIVNDVSALRLDPAMAPLVAAHKAGVVLMHSRGAVADMALDRHADYPSGVVPGVLAELEACLAVARAAALPHGCLVVDPGLGFGKLEAQNFELLRGLRSFRVLGTPVMVGPSRKRFLGRVTGRDVSGRDVATAAACALAWAEGARLFRVHDVAGARDALAVAAAVAIP